MPSLFPPSPPALKFSLSQLHPPTSMPLCPNCREPVSDLISHHPTRHPDEPVPADIVREVIETGGTRCFVCYIPVDNRMSHYQNVHLRAVQVAVDSIHERQVWRGEDGRFACPWCPQRDRDPCEFLVSMDVGLCARGTADVFAEALQTLPRQPFSARSATGGSSGWRKPTPLTWRSTWVRASRVRRCIVRV